MTVFFHTFYVVVCSWYLKQKSCIPLRWSLSCCLPPRLYQNLGVIHPCDVGFRLAPSKKQIYWQNRETANLGSSVGRAPARSTQNYWLMFIKKASCYKFWPCFSGTSFLLKAGSHQNIWTRPKKIVKTGFRPLFPPELCERERVWCDGGLIVVISCL